MNKVKTLKENRDFHRLYNRGKSLVTPVLVIYYRDSKELRYGITTGKKIGNAVKRNRSKRIIRAAFLEISSSLKGKYDFVFVARGKTPYVKSSVIKNEMLRKFKENKLI